MTTTTAPITGLAWHVHHDVLVEWCYDYQERVDYIKRDKPLAEQPTRLRLFQMVKGPIPPKLNAARAKYNAARAKYDAAWAKYDAARDKLNAASAKYDAAWDKLNAARAEVMPQLIALHSIECQDCPWNGETIFPVA